ncbi:MAG TPA: T9SS type A sorting domain-containing protein [Chitinophagales bacterium]|nr:T9SS type A sorting domain-containing protein [Chitinophagales bacterium]
MKTQNLHFAFCSLSNKAVFLKLILIILAAIGFNTAIWAQSAFECFTMPANLQALENDLPMLTCATINSSPAFIQKYRLKETYMPDASTGIKTFQIQFIVITDSNDPSYENFSDTESHRAILTNLVNYINDAYFKYVDAPADPRSCVCGACHIPDSKIRFVTKGINFISVSNYSDFFVPGNPLNSEFFNFDYAFANIGIDIYNTINVFVLGTVNYTTSGRVSEIPTTNIQNSPLGIVIDDTYYVEIDGGSASNNFAHELGHIVGLRHTYNDVICDPAEIDYLSDVFGLSPCTTPICPHTLEWDSANCNAVSGQYCSDNLMGGNNTSNHISPQQMGIIHRNLSLPSSLRKYVTECGIIDPATYITTSEEWDFDFRVYGNVIIEPGATLTLNCSKLLMPEGGKIIVKRGAKLIVTDSNVSAACVGTRWGGIEVWGNSDIAHSAIFGGIANANSLIIDDYINATLGVNDPGMVILYATPPGNQYTYLTNGANPTVTTKNSQEPWNTAYWGGIVVAENFRFKNNRRAVEILPYGFTNFSRFINCKFIEPDPNTMFSGVTIWGSTGIVFDKCYFAATNPIPTDQHRSAIILHDATATIQNNCIFEYLVNAIEIQNTMPLSGSVTIRNSSFSYNQVGILANAPYNLEIRNNTFGGNTTILADFGVAIRGNGNYTAQGNWFGTNLLTGVLTQHTGTGAGIIECNSFLTTHGIWVLGNNSGLQIRNNNLNAQRNGILISSIGDQAGTLSNQGTLLEPRFNLFSNPADLTKLHINTLSFPGTPPTAEFNYFYPQSSQLSVTTNARLKPKCDLDDACTVVNNFWSIDAGDVDPSSFPSSSCLSLPPDIPPGPEACETRECWEALQQTIAQLKQQIDAGQTENLLFTLATAPDALETYQVLKQAGNLLSDTVLIATAMANQMAEWKRADILLDNAPLSSTVMGYVQNHVSTYVYDLLYAISYYQQLSARQVLEAQINNRQAEQDELLHKLLDQYTHEQNFAEIENLLRTDGSLYAVRALVGWYVKQGNTIQAQAVLDSLPVNTLDDQWFKDLQTLNIQRAGNTAFVLQPQQEAMLYAIAGSQSIQSAYAQALLSLLKSEIFGLPVPPDDLSGKTSVPARKMPKLKQSDLETLQLIPNPARTHVSVYIPPITVNSASELELFNQQGNSVCKHTLSMGQRVAKIDLPLLPKGIYVVHLSGRKNLSAKLVIE